MTALEVENRQLKERLAMAEGIAALNHDTIIAQQRAYGEHINKLEARVLDALRAIEKIRQRANARRR